MPVTRRSLFGLIGGAIASLGLDGPAKAAAAYAEALERKIRKPAIIVYIFCVTSPKAEFVMEAELEAASIYGNGLDGDVTLDPNKTLSSVAIKKYDAFEVELCR